MASIKLYATALGGLIGVATLTGCNDSSDSNSAMSQSSDIDYVQIHDGDAGAPTTNEPKRTIVITDQTTFDTETARYNVADPADVDFTTSQVLLVDMGAKPSGGYGVAVVDAFPDNDSVIVQVNFGSPGENCATTQAFTQPFIFVQINSRDELMVNESMQRGEPCSF